MEELRMIDINRIIPHPDNPRKDVGDVTELADSIKKNGIMQNLTVIKGNCVPHAPQGAEYVLLIGHRRYTAAKAAGLSEVPCKVVDNLSVKEQIGIMLEENMQRNDLTILEEADGIQMMIDLGDTADDVAEHTGLSKSTVYHRVNIAKLDREIVEESLNNYQITITDLIELEKLSDVEKRNEILKGVRDSANLKFRVKNELDRIEREKQKDAFEERLKAAGLNVPPKEYFDNKWSKDWERKYVQPGEYENYEIDDSYKYYELESDYCYLVREATNEKKEVQLTPEQIAEKERREHEKEVHELNNSIKETLRNQLKDFVHKMIIEHNVEKQSVDKLWELIVDIGEYVDQSEIIDEAKQIFDIDDNEEAEDAVLKSLNTTKQMMLVISGNIPSIVNQLSSNSYSWSGEDNLITYNEDNAKILQKIIEAMLKPQGFELNEKEKAYIDGTHSIYQEKKNNAPCN